MRVFLVLSMAISAALLNGQNPIIKSDLVDLSNPAKERALNHWKSYVQESASGFSSISSKFWNKYEPLMGYPDIVIAQTGMPSYSIGKLEVYEIHAIDDGFYQICNRWTFDNNGETFDIADFDVLVKETSAGPRLYNYFFIAKQELNNLKIGNIEYFFPKDYPLDHNSVQESAALYSKIADQYSFRDLKEVKYLVANTLKEANRIIGFNSSMMSSQNKYAAYNIKGLNMIVASVENHNHELVHSIFIPIFPNANSLFHEGIATYYGGSINIDFDSLVARLRAMINSNPSADFSDIDEWHKVLEDGTNYYYTIGALFIEYALHEGGIEKVLKLFNHPVTDVYSSKDAIIAIERELGIQKSSIDSFIKNYVNNHPLVEIVDDL